MQRSGRFGVKHFPRWTHFTPSAVVPGLNGVCVPSLPGAGISFAGGPRCGPRAIPLRRNAWSAELAETVQEARLGQPMWGKAKIAVATRRELQAVGESTIGRVLAHLVRQGSVEPIPALRRKAPRAVRSQRKWARRRSAGLKPAKPGEIVQADPLTVTSKRAAARPRSSSSRPIPSPNGPARRPAEGRPRGTQGTSSKSSSAKCPSPSRPPRSTEAPMTQFLKSYLNGGRLPENIQDFLNFTDNQILSDLQEATTNQGSMLHLCANRILSRDHFKLIYERNPIDSNVAVNSPDLIANAIRGKFGPDKIWFDKHEQRGGTLSIPVQLHDNRIGRLRKP